MEHSRKLMALREHMQLAAGEEESVVVAVAAVVVAAAAVVAAAVVEPLDQAFEVCGVCKKNVRQ
jgi:hypothetical protein